MLADKLSKVISDYPNADILLAGGINAGAKDILDYIPDDGADYILVKIIFIHQIRFTYKGNLEIFKIIMICFFYCSLEIHILNERLYDDTEGNFTCFANNDISVVEYVIASSLFNKINGFSAAYFDLFDYLPVCCILRFKSQTGNCGDISDQSAVELHDWIRYKWNPNMKEIFLNIL